MMLAYRSVIFRQFFLCIFSETREISENDYLVICFHEKIIIQVKFMILFKLFLNEVLLFVKRYDMFYPLSFLKSPLLQLANVMIHALY